MDGIDGASRTAPAGFGWPRPDWPVAFVPVLHGRETSEGVSRFNSAEADEVVRVVNGFLHAGMAPGEVGVVTPYAAQVRQIRRMFPRPTPGERGVEVSSVDGFQGREKEVGLVVFRVRERAFPVRMCLVVGGSMAAGARSKLVCGVLRRAAA